MKRMRYFIVSFLMGILLFCAGCSGGVSIPVPGIYVNTKNSHEWIELYSSSPFLSQQRTGTFYYHVPNRKDYFYGDYRVVDNTHFVVHWNNGTGTADEFMFTNGKIKDVNDVLGVYKNRSEIWVQK